MHILDSFRLDGKTAIVTGGTSRFGAPIARALAQAGANVVVASRNLEACETFAAALRAENLSAQGMQMDLSNDESIHKVAVSTAHLYGGIDILVNNAVSRQNLAELEELTREKILDSMNHNIAGQIAMTQSVIPYMKAHGGSIIMMSSTSGLCAPKFSVMTESRISPANYAVEKWGINGLTRWLAAKYGKYNIRVNCLCPSTYDPSIFDSAESDAYIRNVTAYSPIPRFIQAEEIAGPALFLASQASSFCTGVLLPVDGGYSI